MNYYYYYIIIIIDVVIIIIVVVIIIIIIYVLYRREKLHKIRIFSIIHGLKLIPYGLSFACRYDR